VSVPPDPPRRGMPPRLTLTLATALAIVIAIAVASARMAPTTTQRRIVVVMPEAPGLVEGGSVTYLGVNAGRVERIDLSTGRVVATLVIARKDVVPRAGDVVRLRANGLFGDQIVDITPGPRTARALADGDTLVVPPGQATVGAVPEARALDSALRSLMERRDSARAGAAVHTPSSFSRP